MVSSTDSLDMAIDVDCDVKPQLNKQTNKEAIIMIQLIIKCRVKVLFDLVDIQSDLVRFVMRGDQKFRGK